MWVVNLVLTALVWTVFLLFLKCLELNYMRVRGVLPFTVVYFLVQFMGLVSLLTSIWLLWVVRF